MTLNHSSPDLDADCDSPSQTLDVVGVEATFVKNRDVKDAERGG